MTAPRGIRALALVLAVVCAAAGCTPGARPAQVRIIPLAGARSMTVRGDRVFVVTLAGVARVAPGRRTTVWRRPGRPATVGRGAVTPVVVPGGPVVWAEVDGVVAADPADGRVLWRAPHPGRRGEALLGLVRSGSVVVVAGSSGTLAALDVETGGRRWVRRLGDGRFVVDGPVVGAGDAVCLTGILAGAGGRLVCVGAGDGTTLWEHDLAAASSGLAAAGDRLALGVPGGGVVLAVTDGGVRSAAHLAHGFDASVAPVFLARGVAYCDRLGVLALVSGGLRRWQRDLGTPCVGAQPVGGRDVLWVPRPDGWLRLDDRGRTTAVAAVPGRSAGAATWRGRLLVAVPAVGVVVVDP